jgi:hypothetical protein
VAGAGRQQQWFGLGGPVDGLGGLIDAFFHFYFFDLFTKAGKQTPPLMHN